MIKTAVQTVTIALSASASSPFQMPNGNQVGLLVPVITSAALYLQGAFTDTTSADFHRLKLIDGTADYILAAGAGSCAASIGEVLGGFAVGKIESGVAQAAIRTFQVMFKLA